MTQTLTLIPPTGSADCLGFSPADNVTDVGECQALVMVAQKRGIDLLKQPFPGEPEGMSPAVRNDIWSMWIASNPSVRKCLTRRCSKLFIRDTIVVFIMSGFVLGCTIALNGLSNSNNISWIMELGYLFSLFCVNFSLFYMIYLAYGDSISSSKIRLKDLLDENRQMWPARLFRTLGVAVGKSILLSVELRALYDLIQEVGAQSNWGAVSLADQIGMSELSHSLVAQEEKFSPGATLSLSGENSELVSRACSVVRPGRLEELIERREHPPLISV